MNKKYTIVTLESFKKAFEKQYLWSIRNHGKKTTLKYRSEVNRAVNSLRSSPKLHREQKHGLRMKPVKSAYILYKINEDKKEIEIIDFIAQHRVHQFMKG